MSDDPVEWLRLQLDKDEVAADVALSGGPLVGEWRWARVSAQSTRFEACPVPPARVLREVEALRAIVDEHGTGMDPCDAHDAELRSVPCATLRLLAAIYADRPGYQESWRPT